MGSLSGVLLSGAILFAVVSPPSRCDELSRWQVGQQGTYPRPQPQEIMVDAVNYIGMLLLDVHNQNNENNIAFSPYGAASVLVALAEGVQGSALNEILRATLLPLDVSATRIGLRDIHRHLKSYFIPQEGFLAGLTFSHENVTLDPSYEALLKFYGYDVDSFNNALYPDPHVTTNDGGGTFSSSPTTSPSTSPSIPPTLASTDPTTSVTPIFVTVNPNIDSRPTEPTVIFNSDGSVSIDVQPTTLTSSGLSSNTAITAEGGLTVDLNAGTTNTKRETLTTASDKITSNIIATTTTESSASDLTTDRFVTEETKEITENLTTETQQDSTEATVVTTSASTTSSAKATTEQMTTTLSTVASTTTTTTQQTTISEKDTTETEKLSEETVAVTEASEITEVTATIAPTTVSTETASTTTEAPELTTYNNAFIEEAIEKYENGRTKNTSSNLILTNLQNQNEISKNLPDEIKNVDKILNATTIQLLFPELLQNASLREALKNSGQNVNNFDDLSYTTVGYVTSNESPGDIDEDLIYVTTPSSYLVDIDDTANNKTLQTYFVTPTSLPQATPAVASRALDFDSSAETLYDELFSNEEETKSESKRFSRSVIDYLIAKHHDRKNKAYVNYEPLNQLTFLVNGNYRESHISFMTYDTVLPFRYIPYLNALALTFPLDSPKYYLLLVLPVDELGIDELIRNMVAINLKQIVYSLQPTRVKAVIPSFTLKGYVVLTPTLQKMGIRQIFEPRLADFSRMTNEPNIYVTNIEQAVTVTIRNYIDPETVRNQAGTSRRQGPAEFKADHPFLYFVMDSEIHIALMAGKIINPLNSRIR